MSGDGRRSEVLLLDGRRVELIIQPKLFAGDLFDIVASHFNLKEKEYFGLAFLDDTRQYSWLNLDKRVLEHEYAKKHSHEKLILHFLVKYFVENISQLHDKASVELFYLQAKALVANEVIQVDAETFFLLAALVLQSTYGDYQNEATTRLCLKKLQLVPTYILKRLPSPEICEERVIEEYERLRGQSRGHAIVRYMSVIGQQPTYGVHFFEIKDKAGIPYWLGLSYKGIYQFDYNDRRIPRRTYLWKQLENLYFREKKFSIEVRDPKRVVHTLSSINLYENAIEESVDTIDDLSTAITDPTTQVSVSRRTFGPCNVTVYVWFAASAALTKCIWSMAIAQHQFYIDRRNSNKNSLCPPRSVDEIIGELNANVSVPTSTSRSGEYPIRRSLSSHSLPTLRIEDEELIQLENNKAEKQKEMFETLKVRKEALEEAMNKKLAELKSLCLKEGELTGELPPETPLESNERIPQIRRRIGTAFTLNDKLLLKPKTKEEEILSKLELEYEIQSKIVSAAGRLAKDTTSKKNVRKQRKQAYQQALAKMKDLEGRLISVKRHIATTRRQQSTEDLSEDNISHSTDESQEKCENTLNKFFVTERSHKQMLMKRSASLYSSSVPSTPTTKFSAESHSARRPLSPSMASLQTRMNAVQRPRSAAAKSEPTFDYDTDEESNEVLRNLDEFEKSSSAGSSSVGNASVIYIGDDKKKTPLIASPYVNKYEAPLCDGSNLYSVPNRRTSIALKSQDDTHLRHPSAIGTKDKAVINKNHKSLPEEDFQFNRSNSLDNSVMRGTPSQRSVETNSPSLESHHKHYINHYPTYRTTRVDSCDSVPMSPTSVKSYQAMAQRPLPSPPISETHHKCVQQIPKSNHFEGHPNQVVDHIGADLTDSVSQSAHLPNYENITQLSARSVTPSNSFKSKFKPNPLPAFDTMSVGNTSPHPPKTPKGWTETSLDFVMPAMTTKSTHSRHPSGGHRLPPNGRPVSNMSNMSNMDSTKELYVNVTPVTSLPTAVPVTPLQMSPPAPIVIPSAHSSPIPSPQPPLIPSHTTSALPMNRHSIASTNRSIGGDSVSSKPTSIPLSPTIPSGNGVEVTVVSVGHFQPYWEEEKPFELEDFYKYSQKHRKQQVTSPLPVPATPVGRPIGHGSSTADMNANSVQSPRGLLNESFKSRLIVSDAFADEMMNWYEDKGSEGAVGPKADRDKKSATLV